MKFTALFVFCLTIINSVVLGQDKTPKYSNEFLNVGVGARALGMSNAVVASTNSVTAGYWNPTGLIGMNTDLQVGLMHAEYFAGIAKYDYGSIAKTLDEKSAMAFSFIRFGVDNIPNTTELIDNQGHVNYDNISYFSAADMAFIFSYAREINSKLSLGGNAKVIHRKVGDFAKAWGFGLDAAAKYKLNNWTLAAVARDVTTTFNAWSYSLSNQMVQVFQNTGNEIPQNGLEITMPRLILGGSRNWKMNENFSLTTELDAVVSTDGKRNVLVVGNPFSMAPNFGMELDFKKIVFVRGGVGNIQRVEQINKKEVLTVQPNLGIGIKIKGFSLDYALTNIGDASVALYSNIFSLRFNLNSPQETK